MENNKVNQLIDNVEKELIAAIINDSYVLEDVIMKIETKDFSNSDMSRIFGVILELSKNNKSVTEANIVDYINNHSEVQFSDYEIIIKSLSNKFVNSADVEDYVELVKNASIKRQLESFAGDLPTAKIDVPNFNDQIESLEKRFLGIIHSKRSTKVSSIKEALNEYREKIEKNLSRSEELTGITSGFDEIDKLTNGFQKGDLIILAARPGEGKTAMALNFLYKAAESIRVKKQIEDKKRDVVVLFSLEMGIEPICQRLISCSSGMDVATIRKNKGNVDSTE
jgi:replicative DNA helicase